MIELIMKDRRILYLFLAMEGISCSRIALIGIRTESSICSS